MKCFGVFAKYWEPGRVKTRLALRIGPETASELYFHFLKVLLARFAEYPAKRWLAFSPPEHLEAFRSLAAESYLLTPQSAGDLGSRIQAYFEQSFADGARQTLLIGSDSPDLPSSLIDQAFAALDDTSVVLGPAEDGGYYLVGMTRPLAEMFSGISWSTDQVWQQTLNRLTELHIEPAILPTWYDVDEYDDLLRLRTSLEQTQSRLPEESGLLAKLNLILGS